MITKQPIRARGYRNSMSRPVTGDVVLAPIRLGSRLEKRASIGGGPDLFETGYILTSETWTVRVGDGGERGGG